VRDREQVLRVEVARAAELRGHLAREEVALEVRVVGHERARGERLGDRLRDRFEARRPREVPGGEARQALDRAREPAPGREERRERADPRRAGVEQERAELDDLGARVAREPGRLEVDDRERAVGGEPRRQDLEVDAEVPGLAPLGREERLRLRRRCRP
jgi:hypothetical protein